MRSLLYRASPYAAVIVGTVLRWSIANAQATPSTPPPVYASQRAVQLTNAGIAAQNAKKYMEAIAFYQEAWKLEPHTILLFNVGQTYMLAGDRAQAKAYLERYLALEPDGQRAPAAQRLLASLAVTSSNASPAVNSQQSAPPVQRQIGASLVAQEKKANGQRVTMSIRGETRPERSKSKLDASVDENPFRTEIPVDRTATSLLVRNRERKRQDAIETINLGYTLIGIGAVLGATTIGLIIQDHKGYAIGTGIAGFGLILGGWGAYSTGEGQFKSTAWGPVIGPGFAGFAVGGTLP